MRLTVAALLAVMAVPAAAQNWVPVDPPPEADTNYVYDPASVQRDGDFAIVRTKRIVGPDPYGIVQRVVGPGVDHVIVEQRLDCSRRISVNRHYWKYDAQDHLLSEKTETTESESDSYVRLSGIACQN